MPHEDGNLAQAESRAISASLELLELNRLADAASKKVGLAKTEGALPHLSAGLHGERDADLWELGAHLAVGLPVFDRKQGRQLAAQSEYEGLRSKIEATAVHVRSIVRMMLNRIESAGRRARHYSERLVPARTKQLQETLLQYNAMTLGVFQVLSVQRAVTETAVAQVDATLQYLKAREAFSLIMAGRITPLRRLQAVSPSATAMDPEERGH
jgi:outer membrane protein TolC